MTEEQIQTTVSTVFELYDKHGAEEYAGEKVSQLEHMVQAAQLALQGGFDDEVVLAAFLHDVGHLLPIDEAHHSMDGFGMMDHEKVGADYLRTLGFSDRVCRLIASHVNAKRYLTWKYPAYYDQLSAASKKTLEFQGGRMEDAEAKAFEADPLFEFYIQMRRWDEAAKIENQPLPDISVFKEKAIRHLRSSS
ncbi:MAG TPA: HD domain-containing protein [Chitinophagaceae bacterium]|nr:HD domain-containing protein [Chitinophagaceae bacterium]